MRSRLLTILVSFSLSALLAGPAIAQQGDEQKKEPDKKPSQVEDKKGDKQDEKKADPKKNDDKKAEEKGKEVKILAQSSWMAPPSPQSLEKGQTVVIRDTKDYALIFPAPANVQIPPGVTENYARELIKATLKVDKVDFDKQMVVVITAGPPFAPNQKMTITRAELKDGKLVIHYSSGTQEAGKPPSTGVIGLFEKFDGKIEFVGTGPKGDLKGPGGALPIPTPVPLPVPPGVNPIPGQPAPVPPVFAPLPGEPQPAGVSVPAGVPVPPPPGPIAPPAPSTPPVNPAPGN